MDVKVMGRTFEVQIYPTPPLPPIPIAIKRYISPLFKRLISKLRGRYIPRPRWDWKIYHVCNSSFSIRWWNSIYMCSNIYKRQCVIKIMKGLFYKKIWSIYIFKKEILCVARRKFSFWGNILRGLGCFFDHMMVYV